MATRLDDATLGAFERQLEDIEADIDREEIADQPFADGRIVPLDIENKPWARTYTYRRVTRVGQWKLVRSYPTDIPMVNVLTQEFTNRVFKWAAGYWYSDDDIEASVKGDLNIEQEDIEAVVETGQQKLNELIAFGDRSLKMPGFLNHPDVMYSYSPFRLDSSSTGDQCLAVLNDAANAIVETTKQIEKPDTLLLPIRQFHYLSNARVGENLNTTILKQFLDTNAYIKNIQPLNELAGAGGDGLDIIVSYNRNRSKVKAKIYQELAWKELTRKGLGYERPATMKFAGLSVRRPMSIHIIAGI